MFLFINLLCLVIIIGMIIDRNLILKSSICYELLFFNISINILFYPHNIYEIIIILLILWNSIFEAVLGLSTIILIIIN